MDRRWQSRSSMDWPWTREPTSSYGSWFNQQSLSYQSGQALSVLLWQLCESTSLWVHGEWVAWSLSSSSEQQDRLGKATRECNWDSQGNQTPAWVVPAEDSTLRHQARYTPWLEPHAEDFWLRIGKTATAWMLMQHSQEPGEIPDMLIQSCGCHCLWLRTAMSTALGWFWERSLM